MLSFFVRQSNPIVVEIGVKKTNTVQEGESRVLGQAPYPLPPSLSLSLSSTNINHIRPIISTKKTNTGLSQVAVIFIATEAALLCLSLHPNGTTNGRLSLAGHPTILWSLPPAAPLGATLHAISPSSLSQPILHITCPLPIVPTTPGTHSYYLASTADRTIACLSLTVPLDDVDSTSMVQHALASVISTCTATGEGNHGRVHAFDLADTSTPPPFHSATTALNDDDLAYCCLTSERLSKAVSVISVNKIGTCGVVAHGVAPTAVVPPLRTPHELRADGGHFFFAFRAPSHSIVSLSLSRLIRGANNVDVPSVWSRPLATDVAAVRQARVWRRSVEKERAVDISDDVASEVGTGAAGDAPVCVRLVYEATDGQVVGTTVDTSSAAPAGAASASDVPTTLSAISHALHHPPSPATPASYYDALAEQAHLLASPSLSLLAERLAFKARYPAATAAWPGRQAGGAGQGEGEAMSLGAVSTTSLLLALSEPRAVSAFVTYFGVDKEVVAVTRVVRELAEQVRKGTASMAQLLVSPVGRAVAVALGTGEGQAALSSLRLVDRLGEAASLALCTLGGPTTAAAVDGVGLPLLCPSLCPPPERQTPAALSLSSLPLALSVARTSADTRAIIDHVRERERHAVDAEDEPRDEGGRPTSRAKRQRVSSAHRLLASFAPPAHLGPLRRTLAAQAAQVPSLASTASLIDPPAVSLSVPLTSPTPSLYPTLSYSSDGDVTMGERDSVESDRSRTSGRERDVFSDQGVRPVSILRKVGPAPTTPSSRGQDAPSSGPSSPWPATPLSLSLSPAPKRSVDRRNLDDSSSRASERVGDAKSVSFSIEVGADDRLTDSEEEEGEEEGEEEEEEEVVEEDGDVTASTADDDEEGGESDGSSVDSAHDALARLDAATTSPATAPLGSAVAAVSPYARLDSMTKARHVFRPPTPPHLDGGGEQTAALVSSRKLAAAGDRPSFGARAAPASSSSSSSPRRALKLSLPTDEYFASIK